MLSALSIGEIEQRVLHRLGHDRAVLLIFSTYNGETDGPSADFLRRILDYHFQSDTTTDCHCIGYSRWQPKPDIDRGPAIRIAKELSDHFSFFYPERFHAVRRSIQKSLSNKWRYTGGIDLLLFPVGTTGEPVVWDTAVVVSSRKLVGNIFQDDDELIRTVINLSEEFAGQLETHQLQNDLNRQKLMKGLSAAGRKIAAGLPSTIFRYVTS